MGGIFLRYNNFTFTPIPNDLLYDKKFNNFDIFEKVLYSVLLSKHYQSKANSRFHDESGVFVYFTVEKVQEILGCSTPTAIKLFQSLEEKGLIKRVFHGAGKAKKIYVNDIFNKENSTASFPQKHSQKPFERQGKQVSFDTEKAEQRAKDCIDFGSKKNKPRRRF
jgi:hypothetical protein